MLYRHLGEANPSYPKHVRSGQLQEPVMRFTMPQLSLLYRDIMVRQGASLNQLKPVRVITNEMQREFFFAVIQPDEGGET